MFELDVAVIMVCAFFFPLLLQNACRCLKVSYSCMLRPLKEVLWINPLHVCLSYYTSLYKLLLESSRTVIVVTASVKEDEREGQGHTSASLLHQSAM
jgi:hypothetical protein